MGDDAVQICTLPNGCTLYCRSNEAGGRTWFSDEVGGGVVVWDTALVDATTLLAAFTEESRMLIKESRRGTRH